VRVCSWKRVVPTSEGMARRFVVMTSSQNTHLTQLEGMAYACRRCGYCREKFSDSSPTRMPALRVCPVREHSGGFEHHYARGKLQIAQGILEGRFGYSKELIDLLYADPDCKLCSWVCGAEPVLDPPKVWRAMRQDIVSAGLGPPAPFKEIDSRIRERHNVFGGKPGFRSRWSEGLGLPRQGAILYFAGCHASYAQPEIARSTVSILRAAGADVASLGEAEWCCGAVQFHDGSVSVAREMAEHNIAAIKASGAHTLVTACAECYKSFKIDYPEILGKLPFEVLHLSEMLMRLVSAGKLSFVRNSLQRKVAFHDPCRLGRYCGVYDPPREVLRRIPGIELVEMARHREYAWCCGSGADLLPSMDSEMAREIAAERATEAVDVGAQGIVTACPRCVSALRRSGRIEVSDLAVAVSRSLALPPEN